MSNLSPTSMKGKHHLKEIGLGALNDNHRTKDMTKPKKDQIVKFLLFVVTSTLAFIEFNNMCNLFGRSSRKNVLKAVRSLWNSGDIREEDVAGGAEIPTVEAYQSSDTFSLSVKAALKVFSLLLVGNNLNAGVSFLTDIFYDTVAEMKKDYRKMKKVQASKSDRNKMKLDCEKAFLKLAPHLEDNNIKGWSSAITKKPHKAMLGTSRGKNAKDIISEVTNGNYNAKNLQENYSETGNTIVKSHFEDCKKDMEYAERTGVVINSTQAMTKRFNSRDAGGKNLDDYNRARADAEFQIAINRWGYADTVEDKRRYFLDKLPAAVDPDALLSLADSTSDSDSELDEEEQENGLNHTTI
mmetsp:Transcript_11855/g.25027  ORF Transcript_11855/g.25027 Transcript_11855/m.25027 type:complete len:354 (-) Transcript_11855:475-1536(-)